MMLQAFERPNIVGQTLLPSHTRAVLELNRMHADVMRRDKPEGYDARFEKAVRDSYLNPDVSDYVMFGGFLAGELRACLSVFFWQSFPHYTIGSLKTDGRLNLFTNEPTALSACVAAMYRYAEQRGFYRYYYIRSASGWPVDRIFRRIENSIPEVKRYHREAELFVPRRTIPSYPFVKQMMAGKSWPQDLVVESMALRQQYRPRLGFRCSLETERA